MTDDLVKCLRARVNGGMHWVTVERMAAEAADSIEKLEAEVNRLVKSRNKWGKLYNQTLEKLRLSVMSDSEYVKIIDAKNVEQADRIEQLEAALRSIAANTCCDTCQEAALVDRAALGEKKDG